MEISFGKDTLYYKRFVLGQFVAFEGAYWAYFSLEPYPQGHICKINQIKDILNSNTRWKYGRVLDFGFEHPFVLLWYVTDGHTIIFYDEYWRRHATIKEHCMAIYLKEQEHQKILGHFNLQAAYTDHDAQGRAEIQNCFAENGKFIGFPCLPAKKSVMEGILLVQSLIGQGRLLITERCTQTRIEIPSYRAKPDITKEEPIKEQDDTCDAVRMACHSELTHTIEFMRAKEVGYESHIASPVDDMIGSGSWQENLL